MMIQPVAAVSRAPEALFPVFSRGVPRRLCCDICGPFVADQRPLAAQERSGVSFSTLPSAWTHYRGDSRAFPT